MTSSRHPIQFTFTALQAGIVLIGTLLMKHTMNVRGFPDPSIHWHPLPVFLRNYSLLFLLVPSIWAVSTIRAELNRGMQRRYVMISGFIISAALVYVFFGAMLLAAGVISNF